jgi:cobaltochelatase CobN
MLPADVGLHFLTHEVHGIIDPVVVGGMKANVGGYRLHDPIPDRVDRLADRTVAWLNLRHKQNADKKLAVVYYNKYLGRSDVGRGSATGAFLDGPESLFQLLVALKARCYTFTKLPKDSGELLEWMRRDGRNVGAWAGGDLASLVRDGKPVLVPAAKYEKWFGRLSDANRARVAKAFGPAPGSQMVWGDGEAKAILLPRIDLGNVVLLPQPARGEENDMRLLHSRDVPPPHRYLPFYWWLRTSSGPTPSSTSAPTAPSCCSPARPTASPPTASATSASATCRMSTRGSATTSARRSWRSGGPTRSRSITSRRRSKPPACPRS